MVIQARFGAVQTGVGYQFYSSAGTLLGARVTSGIAAGPETGLYIADATVPAGAVGVYWSTDDEEASEDLREALATVALPSDVLKLGVVHVENEADAHSLAAIILATLESAISGNKLTIRKTTGATFTTKTLTSNPNADPIVSIT